MSTNTAEPLTKAALDQFLAQLTDEQKHHVLVKLLPTFLAGLEGLTVVYDERGELVGDLVPSPKARWRDVMMSEEARAAKTRAQWEAERAGRRIGGEGTRGGT